MCVCRRGGGGGVRRSTTLVSIAVDNRGMIKPSLVLKTFHTEVRSGPLFCPVLTLTHVVY